MKPAIPGAVSVLLCGSCGFAAAADQIIPSPSPVRYESRSGWTFTIAPYGWLAGIEGTVGAGGVTTHVDASIGDILSNFDIAVMGVAEARYDRIGVFTDLVYVRLSASSDTALGLLANSADLNAQSLMWTAAAEYRLLDQPDASVDAMAGFRLFSLKNELDFAGGLLGGTSLAERETWIDPVIGLKGQMSLGNGFYVTGWGLIGGGASADITWDLMGGAGYKFTESFSAVVGYRAAGVDYENDGFVYDTVQHGPILGAVFRF